MYIFEVNGSLFIRSHRIIRIDNVRYFKYHGPTNTVLRVGMTDPKVCGEISMNSKRLARIAIAAMTVLISSIVIDCVSESSAAAQVETTDSIMEQVRAKFPDLDMVGQDEVVNIGRAITTQENWAEAEWKQWYCRFAEVMVLVEGGGHGEGFESRGAEFNQHNFPAEVTVSTFRKLRDMIQAGQQLTTQGVHDAGTEAYREWSESNG